MRRLPTALAGGAVTLSVTTRLHRRPPTHPRWRRPNYRDREVTLAAGPALAAGVGAAALLAGAPGAAAAAGLAAGLGLYDDLYGDSHARGLRGHLDALRQGRLTTGVVKLAGLAGTGLAVATLDGARGVDAAVEAALVAGCANLVNLLDLRPGRALKVTGLTGLALALGPGRSGRVATGLAGAALTVLPADLGETAMLGDCGANAAGAALGWCLAAGLPRRARAAAFAAVVALTLASERVSFSAVIERTPWLRAVDGWGRRP